MSGLLNLDSIDYGSCKITEVVRFNLQLVSLYSAGFMYVLTFTRLKIITK